MSESGGMNVNRLTAGGQTVATDVKGNITTLPANLRPTGATTAMNLTWDSDNKLRSADIDANGTADVNFQYDALGRRVARSGTGGSVVFVQMDQQTIADYPVGGAATTPTFRYVYASYIDEPVVRKTAGTGGTLVYFHRNQHYSITAVTTSAGAVNERFAYTAYGQSTILDASASVLSSSAINNRYTYTRREWDATLGLHHFRARWMSGLTGRFLSTDPVKYLGSEWNLFAYCENKSLNRSDPYGLCSRWPLCGGKPLNRRFNGCENGLLVPLVSLWRCVQNQYLGLGRCWDYTVGWVACPFGLRARHSYVCCDGSNKNCFDADNQRSRAMWPSCSGPYWQTYGPAKIDTAWIHFDGTCTEWKVCPAEKERYCKPAVIPFSLFDPNCHHHNAGNWGGTWNW